MKLVILDRDGVINLDSDNYIKTADEWIPIPGSIDAIARLSQANYTIAVATNQSGLSRGLFPEEELFAMHHKMYSMVEDAGGLITTTVFCPHVPEENCACRKPKVGLLRQIETELECSVKNAWFVGDSQKDITVARAGGCIPVLVKTGKGQRTLKNATVADLENVQIVADLSAAVDFILSQRH